MAAACLPLTTPQWYLRYKQAVCKWCCHCCLDLVVRCFTEEKTRWWLFITNCCREVFLLDDESNNKVFFSCGIYIIPRMLMYRWWSMLQFMSCLCQVRIAVFPKAQCIYHGSDKMQNFPDAGFLYSILQLKLSKRLYPFFYTSQVTSQHYLCSWNKEYKL